MDPGAGKGDLELVSGIAEWARNEIGLRPKEWKDIVTPKFRR